MAVKIRTTNEDGSLKEQTLTTHGSLTKKKMDEADKLDEKIKKRIRKIEKDAKDKGLLELKSKKGKVIELYHFVGTELKPFVDGLKLPKTEMEHLWNPINFHAKELAVSTSTYRQSKNKGYGSTWYICYRLASYTKKNALEFDWTEWPSPSLRPCPCRRCWSGSGCKWLRLLRRRRRKSRCRSQ